MAAPKVPLLLLSLGTSGLLLLGAAGLSVDVDSTPAVPLAFFSLLPTLVAVNVVTEGLGWGFFAQLWETLATVLAVRKYRWRGRLATTSEEKLEKAVVADEVSWKVIDAGNE